AARARRRAGRLRRHSRRVHAARRARAREARRRDRREGRRERDRRRRRRLGVVRDADDGRRRGRHVHRELGGREPPDLLRSGGAPVKWFTRNRIIGMTLAVLTVVLVQVNQSQVGIARDEVVYMNAGARYADWWLGGFGSIEKTW